MIWYDMISYDMIDMKSYDIDMIDGSFPKRSIYGVYILGRGLHQLP